MDTGNWKAQLQPESRQRIVNKILETFKKHLSFSGQEGLQEVKKIALRFEENIYTSTTSQSDYLRKISLKMLTIETPDTLAVEIKMVHAVDVKERPRLNRGGNPEAEAFGEGGSDVGERLDLRVWTIEKRSHSVWF
ncbi:hypothetical protein U1Q18_002773 [Sarracenia purpurea var. burkii]